MSVPSKRMIAKEEAAALRCQFGTSNGRGERHYVFDAFTKPRIAMPLSFLRSEQAEKIGIKSTRAVVSLRKTLESRCELAATRAEVLLSQRLMPRESEEFFPLDSCELRICPAPCN